MREKRPRVSLSLSLSLSFFIPSSLSRFFFFCLPLSHRSGDATRHTQPWLTLNQGEKHISDCLYQLGICGWWLSLAESDTCKIRIVKRRVQLPCLCASVHECGHDRALTRRRDADGPLRVDERSFYRKHALSGNWHRNWQKLFQFKPINPNPE